MATSTVTRTPEGARTTFPRIVAPIGAFLAGCGPVVLLGFDNGGYDVETVAGYGIVLWWLLLVGILTGALPRPRPTRAGVVTLVALGLLAAWGLVSLDWSASEERGLTEVCRLLVVAGSLVLGLSAVAGRQARALAGGVLAGLVALCAAGVLSRLQPDLFTAANAVHDGLGVDRLSWPLNYWNGMGALSALTLTLGVALAVGARSRWTAGLAVAGLPVVALCLVMTVSRGGIAAAAVGVLLVPLLVAPRLVALRTLVAPAVGAAILVAAYLGDSALTDVVGGTAQEDAGRRLLPLVALVTLGTALAQAGWNAADRAHWTPRVPRPSPPVGRALVAGAVLLTLVAAGVALSSDRASTAWDDFRNPDVSSLQAKGGSVDRLTVANGAGRYEEWSGAIRALRENPLGGIGLGSWQDWWSPRRDTSPAVRNAHSQPLEVAAELGAPGALALLVALLAPIVGGLRRLRSRGARRGDAAGVAVALPVTIAFLVSISVDWSWQLSVVPVAVALLTATLVGRPSRSSDEPEQRASSRKRLAGLAATGAAAVASVAVLSVAMIAPDGVSRSQAAAAQGAFDRAGREARDAHAAAPFAMSAVLQAALVAERAGDLDAAAAAAAEATRIEPRNWRPWIVLARIEAARDRPRSAVAAYRRARALNPRSRLLNPQG